MKVRVNCDGGAWRVFVEEADGLYSELDPLSCEFSHIDIDTEPPKDGFILAFVKRPEDAPNAIFSRGAEAGEARCSESAASASWVTGKRRTK